jgi:hypothetical protein
MNQSKEKSKRPIDGFKSYLEAYPEKGFIPQHPCFCPLAVYYQWQAGQACGDDQENHDVYVFRTGLSVDYAESQLEEWELKVLTEVDQNHRGYITGKEVMAIVKLYEGGLL